MVYPVTRVRRGNRNRKEYASSFYYAHRSYLYVCSFSLQFGIIPVFSIKRLVTPLLPYKRPQMRFPDPALPKKQTRDLTSTTASDSLQYFQNLQLVKHFVASTSTLIVNKRGCQHSGFPQSLITHKSIRQDPVVIHLSAYHESTAEAYDKAAALDCAGRCAHLLHRGHPKSSRSTRII